MCTFAGGINHFKLNRIMKTVLVTGANKGIGFGIAKHLKKLFLLMLLTAGCMTAMAQQRVKISGHVTDFYLNIVLL